RALDEEGQKNRAQAVVVHVADDVALYTLNQKRRELARIETDYAMTVTFELREGLMAGTFDLERTAARIHPLPPPKPVVSAETAFETPTDLAEPIEEVEEETEDTQEGADESTSHTTQPQQGDSGNGKKRRRRRRGRGGSKTPTGTEAARISTHGEQRSSAAFPEPVTASATEPSIAAIVGNETPPDANAPPPGSQANGSKRKRRRRRKPRSGATDGFISNASPSVAHSEEGDATHNGPTQSHHSSLRESGSAVAPNAPSEPVWGFGSDRAAAVEQKTAEPIGEAYYRREEVIVTESRPSQLEPQQRAAPPARASEPAPEPSTQTTAGGDKQPPRRGWWQRTFKA
ncbi:MAG TPA: hypothetical protein VGG69_12410, partial [Rhizomicrobium sp.]